MKGDDWLVLLAACGHLALGVVALLRGGRSLVAVPLALLCLDLFAVSLASLGIRIERELAWLVLDSVFTSIGPAIALHFVLAFTGKLRRLRSLAIGVYVCGAMLAGLGISAVDLPASDPRTSRWATAFLALWLPTLAYVLWLLLSHLVHSAEAAERARARMVLFALLVGGTTASTDVWHQIHPAVPMLGQFGMLLGTALVTVAVLRFELFEHKPASWQLIVAIGVALIAVIAQVSVFQRFDGNAGLFLFGTALVALLAALCVRELWRLRAEARTRFEQHAVLGRFAAQMAHDLKNPLAALIGAAQFLQNESKQRENQERKMADLLLEQARRVRVIIESYERLARVEPLPTLVDVNDLVTNFVAMQSFANTPRVELELVLAEQLPMIQADPDLIQTCLDNLLRNSLEAMNGGGRIRIETFEAESSDGQWVTLRVNDTGRGMSARELEHAFDEFFTTKAQGSGLGLGFVRRVVLAHRGKIALESKLGRGTSVDLGFAAHAG
jgi:two-component system, NtrC family, sensor histidine kinase HydH